MKKILYLASSILMAGLLFSSCQKENQNVNDSENVTVSISADASFAADNTATLTVKLSQAAASEVSVTLAKAPVQDGKTEVPADYSKNVKIAAGKTAAEVKVEAYLLGLDSGEYQAAIKIASATGAVIGEESVAYINLSYAFKPEVNLYADASFASDKTANLKVALSKATTADVKVKLAASASNQYSVAISPAELTIAAGETEVQATATVTVPENIEIGVYPLEVSIESVENAVMGKVVSTSINLVYPFSVNITIDGVFDDWNDPSVVTYNLPSGTVLYPLITTLKLAANDQYAYMYFEFKDPSTVQFWCSNAGEVRAGDPLSSNNLPLDIYIDADGNSGTGAFVAAVDNDTFYEPYANNNMGLEWYIELGFYNGDGAFTDFYPNGAYKYTGADGENVFSGLQNLSGTYDGSAIFGQTSYEEGVGGRTEIQFQRSFFNMKTNKARFALKIMNQYTNWACIGLMPQAAATSMTDPASRPLTDMATLILPTYAE
ncbi:MAG: hypothetical protein SPE21_05000 [Candidatus Cryptobacteroides sp.]|nr:hypothetical protein [Candidatus Cryptobacteroides sp.]